MEKIIGGIVLVLFAIFMLALFLTLPVYFLWNWLCPQLFGLPELTLFQAWGVMVLCSCLFKSGTSSSK